MCSESNISVVGRKDDSGRSWSNANNDMLVWRIKGLRYQLITKFGCSGRFEMCLISTFKLNVYLVLDPILSGLEMVKTHFPQRGSHQSLNSDNNLHSSLKPWGEPL